MKTCMINGDMSADRAGDQYPTVAVCEACLAAEKAKGEDSIIITEGDFDPSFGEECALCQDCDEEL